jgi:putative OPT family oligopeptide transporter
MLSWIVLVPLINQIGALAAGADGINFFASMSPEIIFKNYVRHFGIGAIAMAGIIGIAKSSGVIGSAFKLAAAGLFGKKEENPVEEPRTQRDIKMTFIITLSLLTIIGIFLFLYVGFALTIFQVVVSLLTVVIIAFLFTTVAANAIAIVGSNPVSGMTLMTLILASVIFVNIGLTGEDGMVAALIIGGIVCTALSMAGGFVTDLKVGYWIGTTPKKQEGLKFLGTLVSAATVGVVIFVLNEAYGFTETALTPDPMVAPQANAMAAIIQPLMSAADMPWMLYIGGAILALLLNFIGIPPLAFALGMYLPLHLNTPLLVGGAVAYFINKSSKDKLLVKARNSKATLITSGFIAGAAIFGVIGAIIKYADIDIEIGAIIPGAFGEEYLALAVFALLVIFTTVSSMKAKAEEE